VSKIAGWAMRAPESVIAIGQILICESSLAHQFILSQKALTDEILACPRLVSIKTVV
jgi:hypothetical protein